MEALAKSNRHRIDELAKDSEALNKLATSVAVMAEKQNSMGEKQDNMVEAVNGIKQEVSSIKEAPGKRWESVVQTVVTIIVSAVVGFFLAQLGLS